MTLRRKLIGCMLLATALAVAVTVMLRAAQRRNEAPFISVEQHLRDHQADLAEAVQEVIAADHEEGYVGPKLLPQALAAPGVKSAIIGERHVTLIIYSNPDTDRGFRVWDGKPDADYADTPTDIPGVFRFMYCDDYPESASNRPD